MLDLSEDCVERARDSLIETGKLVEETVANVQACYLAGMYEDEVFVSRRIGQMCEEDADQGRNVEAILEEIQARQGIVYAPEQRQAVETAAYSGAFLLTGGPGTGKTTCVRGIVALLERMGLRVELAAPRGGRPNGWARPAGVKPDHPPYAGHELQRDTGRSGVCKK